MRLRQTSRVRNSDDALIPLINVVFLLLVFFMVAGTITAGDAFRIQPARIAAEARKDAADGRRVLLVGADGRMAYDGETITIDALSEQLALTVQGAADRGLPLQPLAVKTDAGAPAGTVIAATEAARAAGFPGVVLLVQRVPE